MSAVIAGDQTGLLSGDGFISSRVPRPRGYRTGHTNAVVSTVHSCRGFQSEATANGQVTSGRKRAHLMWWRGLHFAGSSANKSDRKVTMEQVPAVELDLAKPVG